MRKFLLNVLLVIGINSLLFSQATLPTSHDFNGDLPEGWSAVLDIWAGNETYGFGQGDDVSCRLDSDDEYVQIFFNQAPGALTYYIKGTAIDPPAFTGTFTVQESVDGETWSTLREMVDDDISGDFTLFTDNPASTSRYVRFYYTNKESGSNIALDLVTLAVPTAGPEQEINITAGGETVASGSTFIVGNASQVTFTLENLGTANELTISDANLTGDDAADFSFTGLASSLTAESTQDFTLNFTPTGDDGSKFATLSLINNDADENPYEIHFYGIKGDYASEPQNQPASLTDNGTTSYTTNLSLSAGSSAAENFIVLRKTGSQITEIPEDGVSYAKGDYISNAQVVYIGNGSETIIPKNIIESNNYYFKAFAYNGTEGYENYLTASPAELMVSSSAADAGNYYVSVNPASDSFISQLTSLLQNHTQIYYSNYASTVLNEFETRDTTGGQLVVTCVYSGFNSVYTEPFGWANSAIDGDLSREHTFPSSWMVPFGVNDDDPAYSDLFNLFPVQFDDANSVRSNYPLGEVVEEISSFNAGVFGRDASGNKVYEPRDAHKGDAARALFYMCAAYGMNLPEIIDAFTVPYGQNEAVLKQWHEQDLPDNWEKARNEYIQSVQGNRNPFIDNPEWVNLIDFMTLELLSVEDIDRTDFNIYPVPGKANTAITVNAKETISYYEIYTIEGKLIDSKDINADKFNIEINTPGMYSLKLHSENGVGVKMISIQ